MHCQVVFATLAVVIAKDYVSAQEKIPSGTTAGELWNPWTWFWPYAIASAEGYRDYFEKAQKATNELYQQIYKTNAFPWVTGNWGPQIYPAGGSQNNQNQNGQGQNNQNDQGQNNQNNQGTNNQNDQGQNNQNDQGQNNQNDNGQNDKDEGKDEESNQGDESSQKKPTVQAGAQGDGNANAEVNGEA